MARKHGLNPNECQNTLCSILNGIYELIGGLVTKRLRVLGVPDLESGSAPRSVFCFSSQRGSESHREVQYFQRAIFSADIPLSLSALIDSRKESPAQMLERPSLLLAAQPDDSGAYCSRHYVGNGGYGWARPGQELLRFTFSLTKKRGTSLVRWVNFVHDGA